MVGLTWIRAKVIDFSGRGAGPDVRSSDAATMVPGDDISDYSTARHFLKANLRKVII